MKSRIREIREFNEYTQAEFARVLNLSQRTYESYERGERVLPIDVAIQITKKYNVTLDWLFYQKENMNEHDTLAQTLIALRKVFKIEHKRTHNGWDTVMLVDYRFRDFIFSMNKLVIDYSENPRIEEKMYLENLRDIYNEYKQTLTEIFGETSFNEKSALEINEIVNMNGFVLDNDFFMLLGLEDMQKIINKANIEKLNNKLIDIEIAIKNIKKRRQTKFSQASFFHSNHNSTITIVGIVN